MVELKAGNLADWWVVEKVDRLVALLAGKLDVLMAA